MLHAAAWLGDDVATRFLLAHGAEPCCRDLTGWTPLRWAIRGGHCKVVDLLLRNNANPYAECPAGVSDAVFAMSSAQIGMDERFRPFVEHSQLSEASCQNQEGGSGSRRL